MDTFLKENNLASKEVLEKEFGKLSFDEDADIGAELIKLLREKVAKYISLLETYMQPDSHMIELMEANMFTDADRSQMYEVYAKLTAKVREYYLVYLDGEGQMQYFKELFSLWQNNKEQVRMFVAKSLEAYNQSLEQAKQSYLG